MHFKGEVTGKVPAAKQAPDDTAACTEGRLVPIARLKAPGERVEKKIMKIMKTQRERAFHRRISTNSNFGTLLGL